MAQLAVLRHQPGNGLQGVHALSGSASALHMSQYGWVMLLAKPNPACVAKLCCTSHGALLQPIACCVCVSCLRGAASCSALVQQGHLSAHNKQLSKGPCPTIEQACHGSTAHCCPIRPTTAHAHTHAPYPSCDLHDCHAPKHFRQGCTVCRKGSMPTRAWGSRVLASHSAGSGTPGDPPRMSVHPPGSCCSACVRTAVVPEPATAGRMPGVLGAGGNRSHGLSFFHTHVYDAGRLAQGSLASGSILSSASSGCANFARHKEPPPLPGPLLTAGGQQHLGAVHGTSCPSNVNPDLSRAICRSSSSIHALRYLSTYRQQDRASRAASCPVPQTKLDALCI